MKILRLALLFMITFHVSAQELLVGSFNIRYATEEDGNNQWDLRKGSVSDFLAFRQPDFVGLQEALLTQINDIQSRLDGYAWIGVGRDDGKEAGEYSPIFYNASKWELLEEGTFWLSQTPDEPSKSWDAALPRICTFGKFLAPESGTEVYVFNTHYDHIGEVARVRSSELIIQRIAETVDNGSPVILTGDFNATPESAVISTIRNSGLNDAFSEAELRFGPEGTYSGFDITMIPDRRIDYVFCNDLVEILKYETESKVIDGRYLSDHFPVMVTIGLKK